MDTSTCLNGVNHTYKQIAESLNYDRHSQFKLLGLEFILFNHVFSPAYFPSTGIFTPKVVELCGSSTLLEIGSGTGVTAIYSALNGVEVVHASDINPHAFHNINANVQKFNLEDRVQVFHSNLFDSLPQGMLYDTIYWNSNFVLPPDEYEYKTWHDRAFFDPGYKLHRQFLGEAKRHLTSTGKILLGFSSLGEYSLVERFAKEFAYTIQECYSSTSEEAGSSVTYQLLAFTPSS